MNMRNGVDELSFAEAIDGMLVFVTGPVLGATMCPGMFLCLPGIALFGAAVALPLVVLGALALVLGAIAAMPYLFVRGAVRLLRRPPAGKRGGG